jgi:hypothetical protein
MRRIFEGLRQFWLRRPLMEDEMVILRAVREKYPAHPKDVIFFISEEKPLLPVCSSALLQVWGSNGNGPWVHLTNIAGFMQDGVSLDEIKRTQF